MEAGGHAVTEDSAKTLERFDVLVVGGGPVGLATAIELGRRGVRCVLIEKEASDHRVPKGQSLTNRSLELFYSWGCAEQLRSARRLLKGFPIGNVTAYGNLTSPYWFYQEGGGPGRGERVNALFFQHPERLPQYDTEAVMRTRLAELDCVSFLRGWRFTGAHQDANGVTAAIECAGESRTIAASYLVGADGAGSSVRRLAGIGTTTIPLGDRMVLLVFRSLEFEAHIARFPQTTTLRVLKPELDGDWQFFGRIDARDTFFFHAPVPRTKTLENADLLSLMQDAAGFAFPAEICHAGFWDLRISIAGQYRAGRFFIAGDACHSHPPYGGFGLNTGLEDACNLGWKLAAVVRGWGGEALLDSYGAERRPVFAQTADLIVGGIERDRTFLRAFSPSSDKAAFEAAWTGVQQQPLYLPHYAGSPIIGGGEGRPGIDGKPTAEASAGQHLAPCMLSSGRNVFEELGQGFHLVALDAPDAGDAFAAAAARLGVPLQVTRDTFAQSRQAYGKRLILVRPDQYIAWAADQPPQDIEALLRVAAGHAPQR